MTEKIIFTEDRALTPEDLYNLKKGDVIEMSAKFVMAGEHTGRYTVARRTPLRNRFGANLTLKHTETGAKCPISISIRREEIRGGRVFADPYIRDLYGVIASTQRATGAAGPSEE